MRGVHASVYLKVIPELVTVLVLSSEISINVHSLEDQLIWISYYKELLVLELSSRIEGSGDLFKGFHH